MTFPSIDPVLLHLGPLQIRWYGLMYVLGFTASYFLVLKQIRDHHFDVLMEHFENLNLILIISVILGGRLGYVFVYNPAHYLRHPLEIFATWNGGMSFHGACITLLIVGYAFCYRYKLEFWKCADIYICTVPIGLGLGRIGNFINGELFGRQTNQAWGIVFPDGGAIPRHPSQLYEAILEGVLLFAILWLNREKPWQKRPNWPHGTISALFLGCYGIFRIGVENFREPDSQVGYFFGYLTMGQILSSLMIFAALCIWILRRRSTHY